MGHADVMLTLPRSPADRTNNSLTHMQHDKYTKHPESLRAAFGWPAPGPAQTQRAPLITIGPAGTVNVLRQLRILQMETNFFLDKKSLSFIIQYGK